MWNIITPSKDKVYSCRAVVNYLVGGKGILLNEIINPATPKKSPSTGLQGKSEQSWKSDRFRNLDGTELNLAELNKIKEKI